MIESIKVKSQNPGMNLELKSEIKLEKMIDEIIQKDIVSELKEKARGIKEYVELIEDSK